MYAFVIRLTYVSEGFFLLVVVEWWGYLLRPGGGMYMWLPWGIVLDGERTQNFLHPWFLLFLGWISCSIYSVSWRELHTIHQFRELQTSFLCLAWVELVPWYLGVLMVHFWKQNLQIFRLGRKRKDFVNLRRLSVTSVCGRRRSHSDAGHLGSHVHRPMVKWFFKVMIDCLAVFLRCTCGGTNWYSISASFNVTSKSWEQSLPSICQLGASSWCLSLAYTSIQTSFMLCAFLFFIGIEWMMLVSKR